MLPNGTAIAGSYFCTDLNPLAQITGQEQFLSPNLVLLRQACCRLEKLDFFEVETGKAQPVSLVGKVC